MLKYAWGYIYNSPFSKLEVVVAVQDKNYQKLQWWITQGLPVLPEINRLLEGKNWRDRRDAANMVGLIGQNDPETVRDAIPHLRSLLDDTKQDVRQAAHDAIDLIEKRQVDYN